MKRSPLVRALLYLVPLALVFAAVGYARSRPKPVAVVLPVEREVVESIAASGRVRGYVETSVGAQSGGRVSEVLVREGDAVRAGDVIARLDEAVLRAQVRQAAQGVATAQAQLAQASRPPLASDVARLKADTAQAVAVAAARRLAARQRVDELRRGATREERDQSEAASRQAAATAEQAAAQVEQARAQLAQAERDLERQKTLLAEGAVAQSVMDSAQTQRDVARRTVDAARRQEEAARRAAENARARLRQIQVGTRPEQVAQALADLRAAEATVTGARASGDSQLRSLLSQPRPEDVQVARARLSEANDALEVARRRLSDAVVTAPFDGTVTQVVTEAGGVTGPNQPLVRLVRTGRPEVRIDVDEVQLGKLKVGQRAVVTSDAFPGERFDARVREIGAQVDADRGTVEVRLDPVKAPDWLRPGQTVSVNIVVTEGRRRLVVPVAAVNTVGGLSSVLVVDGTGKVARRDLTVGPPGADGVPVVDGLTAQDRVVADPAGLTVGQVVAPKVTK